MFSGVCCCGRIRSQISADRQISSESWHWQKRSERSELWTRSRRRRKRRVCKEDRREDEEEDKESCWRWWHHETSARRLLTLKQLGVVDLTGEWRRVLVSGLHKPLPLFIPAALHHVPAAHRKQHTDVLITWHEKAQTTKPREESVSAARQSGSEM